MVLVRFVTNQVGNWGLEWNGEWIQYMMKNIVDEY